MVSQVKLIAEPWDVGEGGYQVGNFPPLWSEWNGKYRDTVRDFWRGEDQTLAEFAYRFTGSSDLYESDGRRPSASINFVTAHDGFTLADLVSLQREAQRGQRRGQQRRREPQPVVELRRRGPHRRPRDRSRCGPASSATCWPRCCCPRACRCSSAATSSAAPRAATTTPTARTTRSPGSTGTSIDGALVAFTPRLIALRRDHPVFRRRRWFHGRPLHGKDVVDIAWFRPDGTEMEDEDWESGFAKSIAVFLNGDEITPPTAAATPSSTTASWWCSTPTTTPSTSPCPRSASPSAWVKVVDTADALAEGATSSRPATASRSTGRSLVLLRATGSGFGS